MSAFSLRADPRDLEEFSVVYTNRATNHMSARFQQAMRELSSKLKAVYQADAVAIVPGSGTFGMEAIARQFVQGQTVLIVRNGLFSFRWSQIMDKGRLSAKALVCKARETGAGFAPMPIAEVTAAIAHNRPAVVFAPHVETAAGMMLPDDYIAALAKATHAVGGLLVVDSVASGAMWLDMRALGIDVLLSAPQKGWNSTPCAAMVMLSERALARLADTESDSFSCDLKRWLEIMRAYEQGGHAYHATMPTDSLMALRDAMAEAEAAGLATLKSAQQQLGDAVRALLAEYGYRSVAADGFAAPGVVVCHTDDDDMHSGRAFAAQGVQIASGVPLQIDEGADYKSFRIGLFGLDKLLHIDATVALLKQALDNMAK